LQEMDVEGSLSKCIRVLILCVSEMNQDEAKHVYPGISYIFLNRVE
ncbi:MAG: chorismate mutase, partial [Candidatus Aminicenantes bacterium]|nr:chorismate mutase [Candidatus Aminicenantes bacterium]